MIMVVRKRQLFGAICTSSEFIICHIMPILNFSPLEQYLVFLFLKHYNGIYMLKN
jgi:hypothetical protein